MTTDTTAARDQQARDLTDAKAWLCKRWCQDHPNSQHVIQLADYAAYLRAADEAASPSPNEWAMVNRLRDEEADSVTLLCDNSDGPPNNAVECCGFWTGFQERRFEGETIGAALAEAATAKDEAARIGYPDTDEAASQPREGGAEDRFWLIVREPGMVPDRKGPWPHRDTARVLREFIAARPRAFLDVLTVDEDGTPWVEHGPQALQMADGRSMSVGSKHNARVRAAAEEALAALPPATKATAPQDGVREAVDAYRRGGDESGAPAGMKAWHGGEVAPADWDGGEVLLSNGEMGDGNVWDHHPSRDTKIVAYSPTQSDLADIAAHCSNLEGGSKSVDQVIDKALRPHTMFPRRYTFEVAEAMTLLPKGEDWYVTAIRPLTGRFAAAIYRGAHPTIDYAEGATPALAIVGACLTYKARIARWRGLLASENREDAA